MKIRQFVFSLMGLAALLGLAGSAQAWVGRGGHVAAGPHGAYWGHAWAPGYWRAGGWGWGPRPWFFYNRPVVVARPVVVSGYMPPPVIAQAPPPVAVPRPAPALPPQGAPLPRAPAPNAQAPRLQLPGGSSPQAYAAPTPANAYSY